MVDILFLDDDTTRQAMFRAEVPSSTIVATVPEVIAALEKQAWDFVFLDHDLDGEIYVDTDSDRCGMEVVRWIEENEPKMQKVVCHSLNKDAREEMVERLKDAGYDAVELPFIMFGQTGMYEALQSVIQRHADDA